MNATLLRSAKQEAGPTVALVPGNRLFVLSRDHESFISFESLIVLGKGAKKKIRNVNFFQKGGGVNPKVYI